MVENSFCSMENEHIPRQTNSNREFTWREFRLTQDRSRYRITVAIIVWFLPRNEGRQFRYDVGKPWMYGSVIATFDFPIYKTDEAIKHEQDSLLKQFQPYYTVNRIHRQRTGRALPARLQPGHPRSAKRICGTHSQPAAAPLSDGHHRLPRNTIVSTRILPV